MIDNEILISAVEIILDKILTPVLYMYSDEVVEFICFSDSKTAEEDFRRAEDALYKNLGISAEIIDIRAFDETERVEITRHASLLYAESELVRLLFESAMAADKERMMNFKHETISRKDETGSYYTS